MRKILIYNPETTMTNQVLHRFQKDLIHILRSQGIVFEKSRTDSIVVGETKILFYHAASRNAKRFIENHSDIDVALMTHHVHYKANADDKHPIEEKFFDNESFTTSVLLPNYDLALLEITKNIPEIPTELMYYYDFKKRSIDVIPVPMGWRRLYYFPLIEKSGVLTILENKLKQAEAYLENSLRQNKVFEEEIEKLKKNIIDIESHT